MSGRGRSGDDTQQQVWEAAVRLFAAQGFHGTGIRELADAAQLSPATLYHYMGTKQDLLFSIMRTCLDRLVMAAERVSADTDRPQAIIASLVHVHVLTHALHRDETTVVDNELGVLDAERRGTVVQIRDRYEEFWRSAVAAGCERGVFAVPDQRFARMAVLEMCSGVAKWYSPEGEEELDAIATAHAQLALQLLGVPPTRLASTALPEAAEVHGLVEEIWHIQLPPMRARPTRN
ncbi:transcriptional regulator, TetR family [Saccharopolyspora kobensis]|uniref:Transcriptional regulator, TetR family n=1 Tax=Saccharopolyspora kobensis TaxID=146035 RepID=A0A1H6CX88_9PSEU|nr:TetR/AcrR family transcriptional regulator [Saccharopolyspora kobensis]SEG77115.1 transcriptional regulator, TetR family [Saccharopolyspora kobensis]SFD01302.1 transcriptional regulator, TetR family [Saccharopolyspora kobensis]